MKLTFNILLFFITLVCLIFFLFSCQVEECPCVSNSPINGRWYGKSSLHNESFELIINLTEKNSNISGSGNFSFFAYGLQFEYLVTCQGNFVSNKINLNFQGVDSLFYEGFYFSHSDSISGTLFFKRMQLPFGLKKFK